MRTPEMTGSSDSRAERSEPKWSSKHVTELLVDWRAGNAGALDELMPIVYSELRKIARGRLRGERAGHSLESVDLVNEAYLRLIDQRDVQWQNRAHFFGIAAVLMRRILVDRARRRRAAKRGNDAPHVVFDDERDGPFMERCDLVALDQAMEALAVEAPRLSRVVELRFFGGLTVQETAEVLGTSPATVSREWNTARSRLYRALRNEAGESGG